MGKHMIKEKELRGLTMIKGIYHINKVIHGMRIYKNLGTDDFDTAKKRFDIEIAAAKVITEQRKTKLSEIDPAAHWRQHVKEMLESDTSWIYTRLKLMRRRGKENGKGCTLTAKEIALLLLECDGACTVTGIKFSNEIPNGAQRAPFSMSIDRIDSSKGYHYENCRIVCLIVNLAMSNWGIDTWLQVAKAITQQDP